MATYRGKCWQFGLAGAFVMSGVALKDNYVLAQITPDATLGTERSVVIPNAPVGDLTADQIGGGALRGTNLFHSFSEFNVANGQRVYFANPVGIENIFSRVTGNNVSEILGTLGVDGTANLFLLNPNGIIFGPNARLDIAGSFFASTANSLVFENGVQFSATNPQAPPLLTINVTPGLQYGRDRLKPIVSAGNLAVGQNLTLAAGTLNLQGQLYADGDLSLLATDAVQIRDSPANPFIAAARGQLLVQGDRKLDIFALNHPESGFFSGEAMLLRSANPVQGDAHYTTGGRFRIEQLDGTLGDLSSPGDPIIRAGGDVSINTYQGASLHIFAGGQVDLGTVTITGADAGTAGVNFIVEDVTLSDATEIAINGGTQPTLDVRAGMNPAEIDGALGLSGVFGVLNPANPVTQTRTSGDINIGSISINAPNGLVFLTNQYKPDPSLSGGVVALGTIRTDDASGGFLGNGGSVVIDARGGITIGDRIDASSGSGDAGNITLIAQDALLQAGRSEASIALDNSFIVSNTKGPGQGGDIAIRTGSLSAINGAQIESSTEGQGNAGRVTIDARDTVRFDGVTAQGRSGIVNSIKRGATGNSGGVEITTGSLFVLNGAQLQARAEGQGGESGDITIVARDTVSFDGVGRIGGNSSAAITSLERDNIGRAGNILIRAGSVSLTNGGQLQSNTIGVGDAGDVTIIADGQVLIDGEAPNRRSSEILLRVNKEGIGNGGNITIEADSLSLTGGAQLITKTEGQGDAGNVRIVARNSVSFDGVSVSDRGRRSGVISSVAAGGVGNGGAIDIQTKLLSVTNEARVDASTLGTGDARDLTISTEKLTIRDGASILASTFGPFDAGDIIVNATDSVVIAHDGVIASAVTEDATGNGGDIKIETGSLYLVDGGRVETRTLGFIPAALASQYANTPYDVAVLADNPVAYWRLDETSGTTAVDASGNNFN
ncbi:MAG: filamentous hemagglutinin N-terminal domain-containing protein, partial [Coleofasciculus sp. S288]|nr:filamentous hemagglutinin N-terminal domain-containing protein [Coleofasciculus sp. S288]